MESVMEPARRAAYLRAMGMDLWLRRGSGAEGAEAGGTRVATEPGHGFAIGPGSGRLLLLCGGPADTALPVAADIARCLGDEPVWGWPAPAGGEGIPLRDAVAGRSFTGVLSFGPVANAGGMEGCEPIGEGVLLLRAEALADLARDPAARRALWSRLRATGWCAPRPRSAS